MTEPYRKTDPIESQLAADKTAKIRATARRRMYVVISKLPEPPTANEAASLCVGYCGGSHETYRKRIGELLDAGLIIKRAPRLCSQTGHIAATYTVNAPPQQKELF